jgi:hypothetical protein
MLVSSTGQLKWKEGAGETDGFFVMDTAGTKALVGFAKDRLCELGNVTIRPRSRFAAIYVTAQEKDKTIATSKRLLVVVMARARNSGMEFTALENGLVNKGSGPILLEPVVAEITVDRAASFRVIPLDHDGNRTERRGVVEGGKFTIDGRRDRTPYYLVEFE